MSQEDCKLPAARAFYFPAEIVLRPNNLGAKKNPILQDPSMQISIGRKLTQNYPGQGLADTQVSRNFLPSGKGQRVEFTPALLQRGTNFSCQTK